MTDGGVVLAATAALAGAGLATFGLVTRARARDEELIALLGPALDRPLPIDEAEDPELGAVVQSTLGLANKAIERFGSRAVLRNRIERADLSLRPSELVVIAAAGGFSVGLLLAGLSGAWWMALIVLLVTPAITTWFLAWRAGRRTRRFAAQLPDALQLLGSSLVAGNTFLRAMQLISEEFDDPLGDEFARVVAETQLGFPVTDALARMGTRVGLRDVDWMVQAIRIQQQVGGQLADLLVTLAEFMRAREEIRREIRVLTAEGRSSAWVLGAMPILLFIAVQVVNPGYLDPMLRGWGLVWLGLTALSMTIGIVMILRMVQQVEL